VRFVEYLQYVHREAAYYFFGKPSIDLTEGQVMYLEILSQRDYDVKNPPSNKQTVIKK